MKVLSNLTVENAPPQKIFPVDFNELRVDTSSLKIDDTKRDLNGNLICVVQDNGDIDYNNIPPGLSVSFASGEHNTVVLFEGTRFHKSRITVNSFGSNIIINRTKYQIGNLAISVWGRRDRPKASVYVGENVYCTGCTIQARHHVHIGDNCALAACSSIWSTDHHSIFDKYGNCINKDKPVFIGDNVWIAHSARILKGSYISKNSVVGAGALVSGIFTQPNVILAGVPAKIIKTEITWTLERIYAMQ